MKKSWIGEMRIAMGPKKVCPTGKPIYDKKGAMTAKNLRMKEAHIKLRAYDCDVCGGWHLTKRLH